MSVISLCLIIFHALDAPPSKCPETKSDTFCKADFMYYYVYPISDTFTLLASIIGLISNEFTGTASRNIFSSASGQLPVKEYTHYCGKVKDIGGYYLHLFLTAISIIMNISQILYLLPPGSSSSEIFTDIDRILNSKGWVLGHCWQIIERYMIHVIWMLVTTLRQAALLTSQALSQALSPNLRWENVILIDGKYRLGIHCSLSSRFQLQTRTSKPNQTTI